MAKKKGLLIIMNSFLKNIFLKFTKSIEYKILLLFYVVFCFFHSMIYAGNNIIHIFGDYFNNWIAIIIFLIPSFIVLYSCLTNYINSSCGIIIRFNNKKRLILMEIYVYFVMAAFIFLDFLLIDFICSNIVPSTFDFNSYLWECSIGDGYVLIISMITTFLGLNLLGIIDILIRNFINKKQKIMLIEIAISALTLCCLFAFPSPLEVFNFLNPGIEYLQLYMYKDFSKIIIYPLIYNIILYSILIILCFKTSKYMNVGEFDEY